MPDTAPPEPPRGPETPRADEHERDQGKARDGAHLSRRIERNSEKTEAAQTNPTGGAHSGSPDDFNP